MNGESVIVTLWPHPRIVLEGVDTNLRLLNTPDEKTFLLEKAGVDHLYVIPFSRQLAELSPYEFTKQYLAVKLGIKHLILGYNNRFGKNREGNFSAMRMFAEQFRFTIETLPALEIDGEKLSSSFIRNLLLRGEVQRANTSLGYPYFIQGRVTKGNKRGHSIGFPTANITVNENYKLLPMDGVYAVEVWYAGKKFRGMMNIGKRPTVNRNREGLASLEVHIINFHKDIYNENIQIKFLYRIRDEVKFRDLDALKEQLKSDKQNVIEIFESLST